MKYFIEIKSKLTKLEIESIIKSDNFNITIIEDEMKNKFLELKLIIENNNSKNNIYKYTASGYTLKKYLEEE